MRCTRGLSSTHPLRRWQSLPPLLTRGPCLKTEQTACGERESSCSSWDAPPSSMSPVMIRRCVPRHRSHSPAHGQVFAGGPRLPADCSLICSGRCSKCLALTDHHLSERRQTQRMVYSCAGCHARTLPCKVDGCRDFAAGGLIDRNKCVLEGCYAFYMGSDTLGWADRPPLDATPSTHSVVSAP